MYRVILSFLLLFSTVYAQHTSPLVNAGSDVNLTLPVRNTNLSASVTYYDGATMTSQLWTKVQTPRQPRYTIVVIGSSTAAGFPYGANNASVFGKLMQTYYQPLGLVDSVHMGGVNGGATLWSLNITTELNKGGSNPNKLYVLTFPSNGYNGGAYTEAQIIAKFKEWTDSITARGCQFIICGTQPRGDFSAADQAKIERLNDTIMIKYLGRSVNTMKLARSTVTHSWKPQFDYGDLVHGNLSYHAALSEACIAVNPFRYIAENFDKIRSSTSTSTAVDSLSYKGKHLFQFSVFDSQGHGGSDIVAVNENSSCSGTRYEADPSNTGAYYDAINLQPGDTLDLKNKTYKWVTVIDNSGVPGCPIVIQNSGGIAHITATTVNDQDLSQIRLDGAKYLEVRGDGSKDAKGIYAHPYHWDSVRNGSWAVSVLGKAKNIELSNLRISNAGIGVSVKNGDDIVSQCDESYWYPNWLIDSVTMHNCRISKTFNQGGYFGNTSPDNGPSSYDPRPVNCSGTTKYPRPARLGNIRIFDNSIDSTGRAGIQLSSAQVGRSVIYGNRIGVAGLTGDEQQGAGINLGAYSKVDVYNNTVLKTLTYGISSFGASGTNSPLNIYNNNIDSSGFQVHYNATGISEYRYSTRATVANNLTFPYSILVVTKKTETPLDSTRFLIRDNVLGRRKNSGGGIGLADYENTFHKTGNFICNNLNSYDGQLAGIVREEIILIGWGTNCRPKKFQVKVRQ